MKPLPQMLAEWREGLTLSKAEAARRCEMSPQLWQQFEGGEKVDPATSSLVKLAVGTGIPLERLARAVEMTREDKLATA